MIGGETPSFVPNAPNQEPFFVKTDGRGQAIFDTLQDRESDMVIDIPNDLNETNSDEKKKEAEEKIEKYAGSLAITWVKEYHLNNQQNRGSRIQLKKAGFQNECLRFIRTYPGYEGDFKEKLLKCITIEMIGKKKMSDTAKEEMGKLVEVELGKDMGGVRYAMDCMREEKNRVALMTDEAGNPLNCYVGTCDRADAMDAIDFVVLVYSNNMQQPIEVRLVQAKSAGNELKESDENTIKNKHTGYVKNVQRAGQSHLEGLAAEKIIERESSSGATENWTKKVESFRRPGDVTAEKIIGRQRIVMERYLSILEEVGKTLSMEADQVFNKVTSLEDFRKNIVSAAFDDYKEGLNSESTLEIYEMALVLQEEKILEQVEKLLKIKYASKSKKGTKYPEWVLNFKEKLKSWAESARPTSLALLRMCPEIDPGAQVLGERFVSVIRHGSKKPIEKVIEGGLTKPSK